ncbi:amidohydrolase [Pantoea sp. 18069]|uniref:amidohydrolase family protein n=1 Tax=Pantoea sp. 18069 TaxID=2681415 RepID=UPI00135909E2|nr:amidohydrolase family protein [Pantoea sp. 18069]
MPALFGFARPFVDAHHHFWNLDRNPYPWLQDEVLPAFRYGDYSALRRNYLPADYARDTAGFAPAMTVHMEAEWSRANPVDESLWLAEVAATHGRPHAIVAHADLAASDAAETLARQAAVSLVRGIRQKPTPTERGGRRSSALAGSMDNDRWRAGYALLAPHGLTFDLQVPWWNLDQAADLARDFADTLIILNHTGLPSDRSAEGLAGWRRALEQLAAAPNTAVKISGLGLAGQPWRAQDNIALIRDTLAIFGHKRCLFASNFPVDSLVADYGTVMRGFVEAIAPLGDAQQQAVLHDNAVRIYRLNSAPPYLATASAHQRQPA